MAPETRCPDCGAVLSDPRQRCPFCAEAERLLQRLTEENEVRLCTRCGALLEGEDDDLCPACSKVASARPSPWRRDDRVAGWIRDHIVEPVGERQGLVCPSCGAALSPMAIFCSQCGYRLGEAAEEPGRFSPAPESGAAGQAAASGAMAAAATAPGIVIAEPAGGEFPAAEPVTAPAGPSWWQSTVDFWKEQFRPRGPVIEQPALPWWTRVWKVIRSMLGLDPASRKVETWLWVVLGALLVGLFALFYIWAMFLRSGDVVFR